MNRREFTKSLALFTLEMINAGEEPIFDYLLRSTQEQQRLFTKGLSKCDGVKKISGHQKAKAVDMYFVMKKNGKIYVAYAEDAGINPHPIRDKYVKWHKVWEEKYGGMKMIDWDAGHWEGK
jgi:hypothetical protein